MDFNLLDATLLPYVALSVASFALILSTVSLFLSRKALRFSEARCLQLTHDINIAQSGAMGMGQRILAMEKRVNQRRDDTNISHIQDQPYSEASNLFSLGLNREEVARRCSLSCGEASLLEAMQKYSVTN